MLLSGDHRQIERALISLSTLQYDEYLYEDAVVERLSSLSNQLENKLSYYALDALRNLINQAYITFNDEVAKKQILGKGYLQMVEGLIEKAVKLIGISEQSKELCRLVIQ